MVSSLMGPLVPRWTTTAIVEPAAGAQGLHDRDHVDHLPADLGVDGDPAAASSSAAPSITESPMARIDRRRAGRRRGRRDGRRRWVVAAAVVAVGGGRAPAARRRRRAGVVAVASAAPGVRPAPRCRWRPSCRRCRPRSVTVLAPRRAIWAISFGFSSAVARLAATHRHGHAAGTAAHAGDDPARRRVPRACRRRHQRPDLAPADRRLDEPVRQLGDRPA